MTKITTLVPGQRSRTGVLLDVIHGERQIVRVEDLPSDTDLVLTVAEAPDAPPLVEISGLGEIDIVPERVSLLLEGSYYECDIWIRTPVDRQRIFTGVFSLSPSIAPFGLDTPTFEEVEALRVGLLGVYDQAVIIKPELEAAVAEADKRIPIMEGYFNDTKLYHDQTLTYRDAAAVSANNAKTSETNAGTSAALAADWAEKGDGLDVNGVGTRSAKHHAGQAATSATNAKTSENNAKTSETNAANSATTATTAKNDAVAARDAAKTSETNTATIYDAFDDRFLGTKTADPTADNDGAALLVGAIYYNSTVSEMRFWNGTGWVAFAADATAAADRAEAAATKSEASANAAGTSETNAATSATNANNSLVEFKGTYLGEQATDPTADLNGAALGGGEIYFNTTDLALRLYSGGVWRTAVFDAASALMKTNNLSDVADPAAARTNLGNVPIMDDVVAMAIALG